MAWLGWIFLIILFWYSYRFLSRKHPSKKLMLILGSGGHTTEILRLISTWPGEIQAVHASSDTLSKSRFLAKYSGSTHSIPRSRSVGQSYITSIFTTLYSFIPSFYLISKEKPDLIISNGPGTALPICYCAFLYNLLTLSRIKIVFVESICRTNTISLAGRLIYPITTEFYVQWEGLKQKYPKAKYIGLLV